MNWNNLGLAILGLTAFGSAFIVALWISLVIWTFRDMRARTRDAFAQLLAALMVLVLGPFGVLLYLMLRPRETLAEKYEQSLEEEALLQDIEERTICPTCKQPIEADYRLCPVCHARLRRPCVHCGRLLHPRWGVCPYCEKSQTPVPGADRAGRVTLLDLEREAEQLAEQQARVPARSSELPAGSLELAGTAVLPKAEPPAQATAEAEYAAPLESEWAELDVEPAEGEPQPEWLSASDEISDMNGSVLEGEQKAPEEPKSPDFLSWFKRG